MGTGPRARRAGRHLLRAALASVALSTGASPALAQDPTAPATSAAPAASAAPTAPDGHLVGEPVIAPAGPGFYPTATYARNDVVPRPADAELEDGCDPNDPEDRYDPRCREIEAEGTTSMNSPALVVVGGALTVVGALGIAGGVALAGYESGSSGTETSLNCRAGTSGVGCDPTVDTSGAVDVLATIGGVSLVVLSGAVAITGVTLVIVGAVPEDDAPPERSAPAPSVQLSVAPARVALGGTF